jgi:protein-disulfide isomerase
MSPSDGIEGPALTLPVGERDHIEGDPAAAVTLLEYGDFQCPQCGQAYPIVKELRRRFAGRVRFVFRNFPLTNIHADAQRAAEAAEWAATQGAFWPMHDALYEDQAHLSAGHIRARAEALGLDPNALAQAWETHACIARVKEDFLSGIRSGVSGTPTFFIDGVLHEGEWTLEGLTTALERALAPD